MNYLIRPCARYDLETLVQLCAKHAEFERAAYDAAGKLERLSQALFNEKPDLFCWVVEINQHVEGYFSYTFDYSTWDAAHFLYLDCLYLEPGCRRLGIGQEIMKRLVSIAAENNCVNVQWHTPDFNTSAINFYNRIGARSRNKVRFFIDTFVAR